MQVLCIDAANLGTDYLKYDLTFKLKEGEVYEPIGEGVKGDKEYGLLHYDGKYKYYYGKKRFIPLSNIDELNLQTTECHV
jgi:hypothetical protein